jgi:hypothetical protein
MDDVKPWYASKTVWGAALAILSGAVPVVGGVLNIPGVHDGAIDLLSGLGSSIGGAIAAYGRIAATDKLQ